MVEIFEDIEKSMNEFFDYMEGVFEKWKKQLLEDFFMIEIEL